MGNIYNWSQGVCNAYFDDLLIKIKKIFERSAIEIEKEIENVHDNFIHA